MSEQDNNTSPGAGEPAETIESLKAKLAETSEAVQALTAEATKNKALRRKAEQERDELKKKPPASNDSTEDYKKLWEETNTKLSKTLERAKTADINSALTDQFGKTKVASDRFAAALKLVDSTLVEWDEDTGVNKASVVAAVQKLKSEHKFLFESTVDATDPKNAGDGRTGNTITRSIFDALSPKDKAAKVKSGAKIID
jgi:hypothetical protein